MEIIKAEPWNELSYEQALARQRELSAAGKKGWLLFCCPPTFTVGKRGALSDVLVPEALIEARGGRIARVDRGGEVTYHGPGQVVGFPLGSLEAHVGDSRGVREFVVRTKRKLERFLDAELERAGDLRRVDRDKAEDCAGVWLREDSQSARASRKIVAIGMGFGREGIRHGFALNINPVTEWFSLINPCGEKGAVPTSLARVPLGPSEFDACLARLIDNLGFER